MYLLKILCLVNLIYCQGFPRECPWPQTFLIYINDLPAPVKHSLTYLYANDRKLIHSVFSLSLSDCGLLQSDSNLIADWCVCSKPNLNEQHFIFFLLRHLIKSNLTMLLMVHLYLSLTTARI